MKKKTIYKSPRKPRYLKVKVQYYPINKKIFVIPVLLFVIYLIFQTLSVATWDIAYSPKNFLPVGALLRNLSPDNRTPKPLSKEDPVVFHGNRDGNRIALTFDADMTPGMKSYLLSGQVESYFDKKLIDLLEQTNTKATLFLSGMWIELYPNDAKELASNPLFELANHSYSHPSFAGVCYGLRQVPNEQTKMAEIEKTQTLLKSLTHTDNTLFRFPGGCYSENDVNLVAKEGLTVVHWDVAGQDGFNNSVEAIQSNIIDRVQNGSIIILHMNGFPNDPKTTEALPDIIDTLKKKGFAFVKVSELLHGTSQDQDIRDYLSH